MSSPRLALVVARAENGVIGRNNALPWQLPDDLAHFKAVTLGKPILMGRRTFESIGRPLPGRRNLVMSREPRRWPGVECVPTLGYALQLAAPAEELCVIGGADIFVLALPLASRIYLTQVHAQVSGDVFFNPPDLASWRVVAREEHGSDERHAYAMSFLTLER